MFENALKLMIQIDPKQIVGSTIAPPNPVLADPFGGLSRLIIVGIQLFLSVSALAVLFYLLWGAFDWVNSGGDSERIAAAQAKMTNAVIGIILVIVALTIFGVVAGDILGIVTRDNNGNWIFKLPSLNDSSGPQSCGSGSPCPSGQQCIYDSATKTSSCV